MNLVILIGRLTRDPELRYTNNGLAVASFTIAVDKDLSKDKKKELESKGRPVTNFVKVSVWGKTAESCANYTAKGKLIAVRGRLDNKEPYEKEKDGKTMVYRENEVTAEQVKFLEWKDRGDSGPSESNDEFPGGDDFPF